MSEGVVDAFTVTSFTIITISLITIIVLSIQSKRTTESIWKDSKTSPHIQKFTIATLSLYSVGVFFSWILFIEIMTIGYDLENPDTIPTVTFILFIFPFATGLLFTLHIWIERVHHAFKDTEYAFNPSFLKTLRYIFRALCIFLPLELIIWIISKVIIIDILLLIRKVLGGFCALIIIAELFVIMYAYLSKLSQLKARCEVVVNAFDRSVAEMMTKLTALQIKLSVLLIMMIVGTFVCIGCGIAFEGYGSYLPVSLNAFIGFICIYCSIPGHRNAYKRMCGMCLWGCMRYVHSLDELMMLYSREDQAAVHSKSGGSHGVVMNVTFDATKESDRSGGSGPKTPVTADTSAVQDEKELTITAQTEQNAGNEEMVKNL
eukprot:132920_1